MLSVEESVQSPIVEQSGKRPVFHNDLRVEKRIVVGVLTLSVQGASFFGRESVRHEPFGFSIIRVCRFYGYKFMAVRRRGMWCRRCFFVDEGTYVFPANPVAGP